MTHRRSFMEQALAWLMSVSVAFLAVAVIGLSATVWWPYEYVTDLDIAIVGHPRVGGVLHVRVDYCKPAPATPTWVRWTLINDVTVVLNDGTATLPDGCHVTERVLPLPTLLPPGSYRLQVEGMYEPWPWRHITYLARSQAFTIAPAEPTP